MNEELLLHLKVFTHSVPPDRIIKQIGQYGGRLDSCSETGCVLSTTLPVRYVSLIKTHQDVIRVKITTTAYQLRQMLEAKYKDNNDSRI